MTARILIALSFVLGLSACDGGLNLNPLTWFSATSSDENLVAIEPADGWSDNTDQRLMVAQVTALSVERTTSGAIVHATGLPPRLGYWDAELVAENDGKPVNGVITYVFRIASPRWATNASTPYARSVEVAEFIPNSVLRDVRTITVTGERNALSTRR